MKLEVVSQISTLQSLIWDLLQKKEINRVFPPIARSDISVISCTKLTSRGFKISKKKKLLPLGIELTTPTPL